MTQFKYSISTAKGKVKSGIITAQNRSAAQKLLSKHGNLVVSLLESKHQKHWWQWSSSLGQKDILMITKRIGDMTKHNFSVIDALNTLELQSQNLTMKEVVQTLKHQIELGNTLSEALKSYPQYFSRVYISLIKVGEETGSLSKVMRYLEKQEKQIYRLKSKALGAMVYPAVIVGLMIVIAIGMILFLIPFLRDIFSGFQAALPLPTRILLGSEAFIKQYWWALLGGLAVISLSLKLLMRQQWFTSGLDALLIRIPFLKGLIKKYNSAQVIRTFSTLNKTGVPLLKSLEILSGVPSNEGYRNALSRVRADVDRGEIFSDALSKHPGFFSGLIIESVKLGEKSGNLSDSMEYLADIFEQEVKSDLNTLTKLIQPLLLVMVGVLVAGFALSIIVPLQRIPSLLNPS